MLLVVESSNFVLEVGREDLTPNEDAEDNRRARTLVENNEDPNIIRQRDQQETGCGGGRQDEV